MPTFSPTVPPFAARIFRVVWTWRHLSAEVGTTKPWRGGFQGRTISFIGCGASGAYAPGPDDEEEEEEEERSVQCTDVLEVV